MQLPHSNCGAPPVSVGRARLRRYAILAAIGLSAIVAVTIPLDYGRYRHEFFHVGLLAFLTLPSLLAFQCGFLVSAIILLTLALRQVSQRGFRMMVWLLGAAGCLYFLSVWLIETLLRQGEDALAAAAVVLLLVFVPSAMFLLFGVLGSILYAIRKSCT